MSEWDKKLGSAVSSGFMTTEDIQAKQQQLQNSLSQATKFNPVQASEAAGLSRSTGIPVDVVERNQQEVASQNKWQSMDLKKILNETPNTGEFLSNIDYAKQSHDDVPNLQEIERGFFNNAARRIGERTTELTGQLLSFIDQSAVSLEEDLPLGGLVWQEGDILPSYSSPEEYRMLLQQNPDMNIIGKTAEDLKDTDFDALQVHTVESVKQAFSDPETGLLSDIGEVLLFSAESGIASIPDMVAVVASMPTYILSRSAEIGEKRAENKGQPQTIRDTIEALPFAAGSAVLERMVPADVVATMSNQAVSQIGKEVLKEAFKAGTKEATTEFLQEGVIEYLGERVGTGAEISVAEGAERGAWGALAGGTFGTALGGTASVTRNTIDGIYTRSTRSLEDGQKVNQILNGLESSQLNSRNQEATEAFLKNLGLKAGTESVYIDPEGASLLFQEVNDPKVTESPIFQQIATAIPQAMESGASIELPIETLAGMTNNGLARMLQPYMTTTVDALTPAQLESANIREEIQALNQMTEDQLKSEAMVYSDVLSQLSDLGFEQSTAEQYAMLHEAFFRTQARRVGAAPAQLYESYGLSVTNEFKATQQPEADQAQVLNQAQREPFTPPKTGETVRLNYAKNLESSKQFSAPQGMDFGQDIEPAGDYIVVQEGSMADVNAPNWDYGAIEFKNPLVLEHKSTSSTGWKKDLSDMYGGKTGKALANAVKKDGYDGIITYDDYGYNESVALGANKVSGEADPNAAAQNLFVAHNISSEGVKAAAKLGGLAAPSIAIGNVDKGAFESFGEITLLADPALLTDKNIRTFDADVYSPRQPRAEYDIDERKFNKAMEPIEKAANEVGGLNMPSIYEIDSRGPDEILRSDAVKYYFLKENGKAPKPVKQKIDADTRKAVKLAEKKGLGEFALREDPEFKAIAESHFRKVLTDLQEKAKGEIDLTDVYFEENGDLKQSRINSFSSEVANYIMTGGVDTFATREAITKKMRVKKNRDDFEAYAEDLFNQINKGEKLFKGYTDAGNKKYVDYTLGNVVAEMTKKLQGGEGFNYGAGSVRSAFAKEFTGLKDIKADRDRIVTPEEMETIKEESREKLTEALEQLKPFYKFDADNWNYMDDASEAIAEGRKGWNEAFELNAESEKIITDLTEYLAGLPTEYFEAKAQRAVSFSEFSTAIVPKDANKDVVKLLKDSGLKIRKYDPAEEGSREKAVRAEDQLLFQKGGRIRGSFNRATNEIKLTKNANLSTFLHESGHFFLEVMRDLSSKSPEIQSDLEQLEAWWSEQGADTDVKKHEAFASGFESYLMEGKAPSAELKGVFNRFRQWLAFVYKNMTQVFSTNNLEGFQLSDEVRQVMDRLLATQEEIDQKQIESYGPLPIEQMGLSEEDAADYQRLVNEAAIEAETEITAKVMRELQREREKWWSEGVKEHEKKVAEELASEPKYQARDFLSGDKSIPDLPHMKIDSELVSEIYGKEATKKLNRMTAKGGEHPDIIASLFGYGSGKDLINDLMTTMNKTERKAYIQAEAQARMKQEHGDMLNDGSLAQEAEAAVHNQKQAKLMARELQLINQKLGKGFAIKGTSRNVLPIYKKAAEDLMQTMPVDDVKPHIYLRNEQRHGREALRFAAQGSWAQARDSKHKQLRQFYLYRESLKTLEKADKQRKRLQQMSKTKYSTRKVHPDYVQQLKSLVAAYDLRKQPKESDALLFRVNKFLQAQKETNPDLVAADLLETITSWRAMTLEELTSLRESAENILTIGKQNSDEEREIYLEKVNGIIEHVEKFGGKTERLTLQYTKGKGVRSFARGFTAAHRKFESILRQADGWQELGPLQQAIMRPLIEATNAEIEMKNKAHDDLAEIFEGHEALFNPVKQRNDTVEVGSLGKLTRGDRIVLALNWGNSGNRDAILNMRSYPLDENQVEQAIATLSDSDLDLVEKIWEYLDTYYPDLAKVEQQATGIAPAKVEPEPFIVNGRRMSGGYYPLQGDATVDSTQNMHDIEERAKMLKTQGGAARASSKHGATIERKGWKGKAVNLSIDSLFSHVDGVIHDITHRQAVREADHILSHPELKETMANAVGEERFREVRNKLTEVAAGHVHPSELSAVAKLLRYTRLGLTYNVMGYSIRTAIVNVTGIASSIPVVGKTRMAVAAMEFLGSPMAKSDFIINNSPAMRNRAQTVSRDVYDIMRNLRGNGLLNSVRQNAFIFITKVDAVVSRITWLAAYNKGLADFGNEKDAIYHADRVVARTQGSGLLIDQSSIESQNEFVKTFTTMYSYFNAQLNLLIEQAGKARTGQISKAKLIENLIWIMIIPAVLEEAMTGKEGDEDDDLVDSRWTKAIASYNLGYWVGIRDASGLVKYGMSTTTPVGGLLKSTYDLGVQAEQGEIDQAAIRAAAGTVGTALQIPGGIQMTRSVGYLMKLEESGGDFNLYDFLVTGKVDND